MSASEGRPVVIQGCPSRGLAPSEAFAAASAATPSTLPPWHQTCCNHLILTSGSFQEISEGLVVEPPLIQRCKKIISSNLSGIAARTASGPSASHTGPNVEATKLLHFSLNRELGVNRCAFCSAHDSFLVIQMDVCVLPVLY